MKQAEQNTNFRSFYFIMAMKKTMLVAYRVTLMPCKEARKALIGYGQTDDGNENARDQFYESVFSVF